ncbi:DUF4214 domain-containing protein [Marimonas sp. MJW-29]|uniref:DUF4214 domain-containing protein n=1 Tax=Sulfitobacter sediminis TaxID=3234186 RepID=A0ABV3RJ43_9RHOB
MPLFALTDIQGTGQYVSADMFGANAVFERTLDGTPTTAFVDAARTLGVQNIRFGGGQSDLDPQRANADGSLPVDGVSAINIVDMPGGSLRPELVNFLDWCAASTLSGHPVQTTLIIPTKHLGVSEYAAFADEIAVFVQTVMQQYGPLISAFQIGNEYWEMGETAYGQKASIAATAIAQGMSWAGVAERDQPEILIQMATAGNNGSEFGAGLASGSYNARTDAANAHIIAQLSAEARDAIDGVTEHYYYNRTDFEFPDARTDLRSIDRDYAVWDAAFSKDLSLHITEWNIRTTAEELHGLVAASTMVRQFENMIDLGVDSAHVWTFDYHSRTALTLDTDGGVRLDGEGRLINSAHGAIFDLMADALVGKELVSASFDSAMPGIDVSAYAAGTEMTLYVSSRSTETTAFTLDLTNALPGAETVTGVQVSLDPGSTDGRQWVNGEAADRLIVNGADYFYNEHDADVILTDLTFADASRIDLTLNPFEVVELTLRPGQEAAFQPAPVPAPVIDVPFAPVIVAEPVSYGELAGSDRNDWIELPGNVSRVSGGGGTDTLALNLARDAVDVLFNGYGWAELYADALPTAVTLDSVERLAFSDGTLALDTMGLAGQAYRLYQAGFDRTPDAAGLGFWIGQLDSGAVSLAGAARHFIASQEFQSAYGNEASLGDAAFLDLVYLNVLNRRPDQAGYDFWEEQLAGGLTRADMLVHFSESAENVANVAGQIADGIWF